MGWFPLSHLVTRKWRYLGWSRQLSPLQTERRQNQIKKKRLEREDTEWQLAQNKRKGLLTYLQTCYTTVVYLFVLFHLQSILQPFFILFWMTAKHFKRKSKVNCLISSNANHKYIFDFTIYDNFKKRNKRMVLLWHFRFPLRELFWLSLPLQDLISLYHLLPYLHLRILKRMNNLEQRRHELPKVQKLLWKEHICSVA